MFNAGKQSLLTSAIICLALAVLFALRYLLAPYAGEEPFASGMPLAAWLTAFSVKIPWLAGIVAFGLVLWTLFLVVQLTGKYSPTPQRNYIPPQIFLIAAAGIAISGEALVSFLAAWLLTLSIHRFISSLHKGFSFAQVFRAGLYTGLIPLIYAPFAAVAVVVVPAALAIYKRSAREWTVGLVGLVLPVITASYIYWAADIDPGFFEEMWQCMLLPVNQIELSIPQIALGAMVLAMALTGVVWSLGHKKGARRKQYLFMLHITLLIGLLAASAMIPGSSFSSVALAAAPLALAVPHAFVGKWWQVISSVFYVVASMMVFVLNLLTILL